MANSCTSLSSQALPSFVLDDLKKGLCNHEMFIRVIHLWEARNVRKGGLLLGFELLLMDKKGDDNGTIKNHTYKFNIQLKAFARQTITVTSIIKEIVDDEDSVQEEAAALEGTHGDALCEDGSKTLVDDDAVAINQKKEKIPP